MAPMMIKIDVIPSVIINIITMPMMATGVMVLAGGEEIGPLRAAR